ncbi:hypothetical protein, partial [Lactobacillus crispatus]|uniref:hypothetical protein n=1 Tax=Lactobacillus crispatus TaxID=47770 RepID=UPI003B003CD2
KRSRFLKKEILIVFIHLEASFFPDTLIFYPTTEKILTSGSAVQVGFKPGKTCLVNISLFR